MFVLRTVVYVPVFYCHFNVIPFVWQFANCRKWMAYRV